MFSKVTAMAMQTKTGEISPLVNIQSNINLSFWGENEGIHA